MPKFPKYFQCNEIFWTFMSKNALPLDVASVIKCLCEVLDLVTKALKNEIHFEKNNYLLQLELFDKIIFVFEVIKYS